IVSSFINNTIHKKYILSLHDALPIYKKSKYDKKLFIARRELNDSSNLYSILISKIIEIIKKYEIKTKNNVIDVGTGEGYIIFSLDRKSTRLNSSHVSISYAVFCLKKK